MKAAVLKAHGQPLEVCDVELEPPRAGEVRIAIGATGVCHSDLICRDGGFPVYGLPLVPGHEAAGTVVEVGEGVTKVKEGDRVIVGWIPYCGRCWHCRRGEVINCPEVAGRYGVMFDGTPRLRLDGASVYHGLDAATFAEEAVLNQNAVTRIDDDVPFEVAALLGCAVGTGVGAVLNTVKLQEGARIAVIGCGGVGLNVIQGARIAGASRIIAIDKVATKLDAAKRMGATDTIDAEDGDPQSMVFDITGGVGVDYAFEVIGNNATQQLSLRLIRRGGSAVFVGVSPLFDPMEIRPGLMTLMGQSIIGCYFGSMLPERDLPKLIDLWRSGLLDLEGLISDRGGLEDINDAFTKMESGNVLRTVITP